MVNLERGCSWSGACKACPERGGTARHFAWCLPAAAAGLAGSKLLSCCHAPYITKDHALITYQLNSVLSTAWEAYATAAQRQQPGGRGRVGRGGEGGRGMCVALRSSPNSSEPHASSAASCAGGAIAANARMLQSYGVHALAEEEDEGGLAALRNQLLGSCREVAGGAETRTSSPPSPHSPAATSSGMARGSKDRAALMASCWAEATGRRGVRVRRLHNVDVHVQPAPPSPHHHTVLVAPPAPSDSPVATMP